MSRKIKLLVAGIIIAIVAVILFSLVTYFGLKTVGEGEKFEADFMSQFEANNKCKFGLKLIPAAVYAGEKFGCAFPACDCFICTKCGDGICGKGENECNCKEDCKHGEGEQKEIKDIFQPEFHKTNDFNG